MGDGGTLYGRVGVLTATGETGRAPGGLTGDLYFAAGLLVLVWKVTVD